MSTITLLACLEFKHFLADFVLQRPYQFLNKGRYGHPGGVLHASIHGVGTFLALLPLGVRQAIVAAVIDAIVHYHIDWSKEQLVSHFNARSSSTDRFWWLLGADQMLHHLTYLVLVAYSVY